MKNKIEFKKVLLYITFTVLLFMILFGIIQTYQYKTYTENFNERLMSIILKLNEEYPELNKNDIVQILNSSSAENENILGDDKKSTIFTDSLLISANSNYGDDPTTTQAFAVKLAANEIDILLVEKNNFEYFAANNMLLNSLEGFNSLNISEDELVTAKDETGNDNLYGIKVDNLNLLKNSGFNNENTILCIAISSNRHEEVIKVLNELTK